MKTILIILSIFLSINAIGQNNEINKADNAFQGGNYYEAIVFYKRGLSKFSNKHFIKTTNAKERKALKATLIFQIAECYRLTGDIKHAEEEYAKAIKAHYSDSITAANYEETMHKQLDSVKLVPAKTEYQNSISGSPH